MSRTLVRGGAALAATAITVFLFAGRSSGSSTAPAAHFPSAALDAPLSTTPGQQTAVLSGGCFWGMQLVFEHVKGVTDVEAGYAGGTGSTATYEQVSTGTTGHAESVRITYDPSRVTYGQLLQVFFFVAHDPTELNRQGPDVGPQYRSMISYTTDEQKRIAESYIAQLERAKVFRRPIVTQVVPFSGFHLAEAYHQDYAVKHPGDLYIAINDQPKLPQLEKRLPALYRTTAVAYAEGRATPR